MRVYKFRLYPNKQQEQILFKQLNICRFTYNQLLDELSRNKDKKHIQHYIVELKKTNSNLNQVYSKTLQYECYRLFSNLTALSQAKKKGRSVGKLRFKGRDWFKTIVFNQSGFKLTKTTKRFNVLELSKIGKIKLLQHREIDGKIKGIIIKRKVDSWEAHIITDAKYQIQKGEQIKGFDLGVIDFLVDQNNNKIKSSMPLNNSLKKLKTLSQKLSKKKKGSNNRYKAKKQLAKLHEKISEQRNDFLHKITTTLIKDCKFIGLEDLNIKGLHHISYNARNMNDCSWGKFVQLLKFKAESAGTQVELVNPKNTTKMCSQCGHLKNMPLNVRNYKCSNCGMILGRDHNSAKNIIKLALEQGNVETKINSDFSSMKQEAITLTNKSSYV